jgi:hypothetical protein
LTAARVTDAPPGPRWLDPALALSLLTVCLGLYAASLAPGLAYGTGDSNEIATVAATLRLAHPTGYPLHTWIGFLFATLIPVGSVAYRTNLMSAVLGAAGVAVLYLVARQLHVRRPFAALAALLFGVSTTLWSQAVITEVYAPNVLMVSLTLWLLLRWGAHAGHDGDGKAAAWSFAAFALVFGLSLGMHLSNLGFAPAFALFTLLTDRRILVRPRPLVLGSLGFLLGVAQFLWLPLMAHTIDPATHAQPDTLRNVYRFTFDAFSPLRFAFPLAALPQTVAVYLSLLAQNFSRAGVGLGLLGMWVLLWRRASCFWLLFGMYLVHVVFFTQYQVPDTDVFFIPSHLVFAIFVAVGIQGLYEGAGALVAPSPSGRRPSAGTAVALALTVALLVLVAATAGHGLRANDRTRDTALEDFYRGVFALLPLDSVLVGSRGVFGFDMLHWRHVYHLRPDVTLPLDWPPPAAAAHDAPLFTTLRVENGRAAGVGPWGPPAGLLPADAWYVPVLVGNRHKLVLYRAEPAPPPLMVADARPDHRVDRSFGGVTLLGYDLGRVMDAPGPQVHLKTFWRVTEPAAVIVGTRVGDTGLEAHELLFGNLPRYIAEVNPPGDGVLVEEFDLVLPSWLAPGMHTLSIGVTTFPPAGVAVQWVDLGDVRGSG